MGNVENLKRKVTYRAKQNSITDEIRQEIPILLITFAVKFQRPCHMMISHSLDVFLLFVMVWVREETRLLGCTEPTGR